MRREPLNAKLCLLERIQTRALARIESVAVLTLFHEQEGCSTTFLARLALVCWPKACLFRIAADTCPHGFQLRSRTAG